jgi:branched-chain amino acid transport system substrate-binding protein
MRAKVWPLTTKITRLADPAPGARAEAAGLTAVVYPDGSVAPRASSRAARYLRARRQLLAYACAFSRCPAESASFYWLDRDGQWLQVQLAAARPQPPGREELAAPAVRITVLPGPLPERLTTRELDVLTLLAGGLSNRQIGSRLESSARTVSTHVEHILGKLSQASRAGAAAVAVDRGYLRLPLPGGAAVPAGLTVGYLHAHAVPAAARAAVFPAACRVRARPLRIGSAFPLTGPASDDGQQMLTGSTLAVAEINARGGIGGRPLEHVVVDIDIFSADGVRQAFEQLFSAEIDAVVTGYVLAAEDVVRELAVGYGAPFLHAITSEAQAQAVRDNLAGHRCMFQVCPTELHYAPGFIRFLGQVCQTGRWRPRNRRIAFVETPVSSGQLVNQQAMRLAEQSGWEITEILTVPALGADLPSAVDRIERLDPAAVMVSQFLPGELAAFRRLMARRFPQTLVYAVYAPSVPEFLQQAGPAAEGLVWSTVSGTYSDAVGRRFAGDYARAFGRSPGRSHAGIAYDEVNLLAQAWLSVPDPFRFGAVARQLRRIRYRGVNGSYCLDNHGQTGLGFPDVTPDPSLGQAHLVFQVQDGKHRIIWPPPYSETSFRPPERSSTLLVG